MNQRNIFKHTNFQKPPVQRPTGKIGKAGGMGSGEKTDPAIGRPIHGRHVLGGGNLVQGNPLRGHGPQEQFNPRRLGKAREDVGAAAHRQLRDSVSAGSQFSPLVHQTNPSAKPICGLTDQVPKHCGLTRSGRTENQGGAGMAADKAHHRIGTACPFSGKSEGQGLKAADGFYPSVLRGGGPAEAQAMSAGQGQIALAELLLHRVGRISRGSANNFLQQLRRNLRQLRSFQCQLPPLRDPARPVSGSEAQLLHLVPPFLQKAAHSPSNRLRKQVRNSLQSFVQCSSPGTEYEADKKICPL